MEKFVLRVVARGLEVQQQPPSGYLGPLRVEVRRQADGSLLLFLDTILSSASGYEGRFWFDWEDAAASPPIARTLHWEKLLVRGLSLGVNTNSGRQFVAFKTWGAITTTADASGRRTPQFAKLKFEGASRRGIPIDEKLGKRGWSFNRDLNGDESLRPPLERALGLGDWNLVPRLKSGEARLTLRFRREDERDSYALEIDRDLIARKRRTIRLAPFEIALETRRLVLRHRQRPDPPRNGETQAVIEIAGIRQDELLRHWNDVVADPHLEALHTVRAGQPVSAMPWWIRPKNGQGEGPDWAVRFKVTDGRPGELNLHPGDLSIHGPGAGSAPVRVLLEGIFPRGSGEASTAELRGLLHHNRKPARWRGRLDGWSYEGEGYSDGAWGLPAYELKTQGVVSTAKLAWVRIGALDLAMPRPKKDATGSSLLVDEEPSIFRAAFGTPAVLPEGASLPRVRISLHVPVRLILPGGQDALPESAQVKMPAELDPDLGDRERRESIRARFAREPAIVIPEAGQESAERDYRLRLDEETRRDRSQSVRMLLRAPREQSDSRERLRVLVVDRHPLFVARIDADPLSALGGEDREIGNWSAGAQHGASWELRRGGDAPTLILPPATVGEAMEKGKADEGYLDIEENEPSDFRFGSPTVMRILTSLQEKRFDEPAWNLRRHFGYPGQRAPGAPLESLQLELLYGMVGRVSTEGLLVAEIAARLGEIPGALPERIAWKDSASNHEKAVYFDHRDTWSQRFRSYLSRVSVVEPWRFGETGPLELTDGVSFRLRASARMRYPVPGGSPAPNSNAPNFADGLAGGVGWAFESARIYDRVWRNPDSDTGVLRHPALSLLGGWGHQEGEFDNRLTKIYSDTAQGRVFHYTLERIGRIGVYWNKAKHVIVYERTIGPTAQFAEEQDRLLGRPVLRKVKEYVEILEPVRQYPERGIANRARGFIEGCEFKSTVIPVTSRWGRDLEQGWEVPLWDPNAASEIYPKPQVVLKLTADPRSGPPHVHQAVDAPERLYFFTLTEGDVPFDTDQWQPIAGVDFALLPLPSAPNSAGFARSGMDAMLPNAPSTPPGFERFTVPLELASRPANVTAERGRKAIAVPLRTVTMQRATRNPKGRLPASAVHAAQLPATVDAALAQLREVLPDSGVLSTAARPRIEAVLRQLRATAPQEAGARALGQVLDGIDANQLRSRADLVTEIVGRAKDDLASLETRVSDALKATHKNVRDAVIGAGTTVKETLRRIVAGELRTLEQTVIPVASGVERFIRAASEVRDALVSFQSTARREQDRLLALIEKWTEPATGDIPGELRKRLQHELEVARRRIRRASDLYQARLAAKVASELGEAARTAQHSLEKVRRGFESVFDDARHLVGFASPEDLELLVAKLQFVTFVRVGDETFPDWAAAVLDELNRALEQVREGIEGIRNEFENYIKNLNQVVNDWAGGLGGLLASLDDGLEGTLERIASGVSALKNEVKSFVEDHVKNLLPDEKEILRTVRSKLADANTFLRDELEGRLDDFFGRNVNVLRDELNRIQDAVEREFGPVFARATSLIDDIANSPVIGDSALRLLSAFGQSPQVPGWLNNRDLIQYFFDEAKDAVDLTPITSLVNRLGDGLKGLGMRLPSRQALERMLPDPLELFDLREIFPDFGGLDLSHLLPDLKLPRIANKNVVLQQDIDPQSRRATVRAHVNIPITKEATVFDAGPVTLRLLRARFRARAEFVAQLGSAPTKTMEGTIRGEWALRIGGMDVVTFRDTRLEFDDSGRFDFDLSPANVHLHGALRFVSDLVRSFSDPDSGFNLELLEDGGLPAGIRARIDLPLPDVQFGAFGMSNLNFGTSFELHVVPEFALGTTLNFARKTSPFTLTIFILTGGGWFETSTVYRPASGGLSTRLSVGMVAGASIGFAFGPLKGGVSILFGIEAEMVFVSGRGGTLTIGIMLLIRGELSVLGFVSVYLSLLLEARYRSDGRLIGRGTISLKIKICWCFTIKVRASVEYVLSEGSGTKSALADGDIYDRAAKAYIVESFE